MLKKVVGRHIEDFKTKDGKTIPGEFFIHFIGVVHNNGCVKKFQAIQKDYGHLIIKIVISDNNLLEKFKADVTNSTRKVMGQDCRVDFEQVDEIAPASTGKYLCTICEIKK